MSNALNNQFRASILQWEIDEAERELEAAGIDYDNAREHLLTLEHLLQIRRNRVMELRRELIEIEKHEQQQ